MKQGNFVPQSIISNAESIKNDLVTFLSASYKENVDNLPIDTIYNVKSNEKCIKKYKDHLKKKLSIKDEDDVGKKSLEPLSEYIITETEEGADKYIKVTFPAINQNTKNDLRHEIIYAQKEWLCDNLPERGTVQSEKGGRFSVNIKLNSTKNRIALNDMVVTGSHIFKQDLSQFENSEPDVEKTTPLTAQNGVSEEKNMSV